MESQRDAVVDFALEDAEPFVEDAEEDDGEAGCYECRFGVDVPAPEDDAGAFDLSVPGVVQGR